VPDITPQPLDADFYFDADNVRLFPAPSQDTLDYIETLAGSADTPITFQTFDDSNEKRGSLAKVIHGSVWECFGRLRELNLAGAGVFVTVNETDGLGRKAENVKRVRALFVDFDETSASPNLEPSFRVESARGEHWYWLVSDCDLSRFEPLQTLLAKVYGSDPKVKDLPRVMRLPGFAHRKAEPKHVTFRSGSGKTYSLAEIEAAHRETPAGRTFALPVKGRNDTLFEQGAAWIDENPYASKDQLRAHVLRLNQNFEEPLSEREIDSTVMISLPKKLQASPLADIRPWNLADFCAEQMPPYKGLLGGQLLARETLALIIGRRASKKTYTALHLAMCFAQGEPFGDLEAELARVLFVSLEMGRRAIQNRLKKLVPAAARDLDFVGICRDDLPKGFRFDLTTDAGAQALTDLVRRSGAVVWFLDSLRTIRANADENSNTEMGPVMERLEQITLDTNTCGVLIHHMGKAGADGVDRGGRGASAIEDVPADVLSLDREKGGEWKKCRDSPLEGSKFSVAVEDAAGGSLQVVIGKAVDVSDFEESQQEKKILRYVESIGTPVTRGMIRGAMNWSERTTRTWVNGLLGKGLLIPVEKRSNGVEQFQLPAGTGNTGNCR
jgi:hypothetical protein